ncbi:MAG TPA: hypothetical protein VHR45_02165 [Thermoanaerobaculia bacterium]|nr:hypothetical protein [Thermoanaerobaculia bacterium]
MKQNVEVVLTREARGIFKDEPIQFAMKRGEYFICRAIEQDGAFLDMTVQVEQAGELQDFKVSIPVGFVLYIVSDEHASALGFKGLERSEQKT